MGSQTWKGPPGLAGLNYVTALVNGWVNQNIFSRRKLPISLQDRIHHFTNCSSDWLWPLSECFAHFWSVSSNTFLLRNAFYTLARLESITKPPFSMQLLTDSLSLSVALPMWVSSTAPPLPQSHRTLGREPLWAAPSGTIRVQLPQGARPKLHSESGTGHHSGLLSCASKRG